MSLHHACGVHQTMLKQCAHGDTPPADQPLLPKYGTPAHNALKEVLLSEKLRKKLPYLVRYRPRHTTR